VLGLNDESMVLSVIIRKIITNLKYWGGSEQVRVNFLVFYRNLHSTEKWYFKF
jgi:hypothetical protein